MYFSFQCVFKIQCVTLDPFSGLHNPGFNVNLIWTFMKMWEHMSQSMSVYEFEFCCVRTIVLLNGENK